MKSFKAFILDEEGQLERGMNTIPELLAKYRGKKLLFWDTESTGINPNRPHVQTTELAAYCFMDGEAVARFHQKGTLTPQAEKFRSTEVKRNVAFKARLEKRLAELRAKGRTLSQQDKAEISNIMKKIYELKPDRYKTMDDLLKMQDYEKKDYVDPITQDSYTVEVKPVKEMLTDFVAFVQENKPDFLIAYNQRFDLKQLNTQLKKNGLSEMPRIPFLDAIQFARLYIDGILDMSYFNMLPQNLPERLHHTIQVMENEMKPYRYPSDKNALPQWGNTLGKMMNVFDVELGRGEKNWHSALFDTYNMSRITEIVLNFLEMFEKVMSEKDKDNYYRLVAERAGKNKQNAFLMRT